MGNNLYVPVKSDLQIAGGLHGDSDVLIRPPWQGERCEAVLLYVTAWGNTAVNILYLNADSSTALMGAGATSLPNMSAPGGVWVINGAGTINLGESVIGVTQYLRITPQPAASGQIYLGFYWRKVVELGAPKPLVAPEVTEAEEMTLENDVWRKTLNLPPRDYRPQSPGKLRPEQEKILTQDEAQTDMRRDPSRTIQPGGPWRR